MRMVVAGLAMAFALFGSGVDLDAQAKPTGLSDTSQPQIASPSKRARLSKFGTQPAILSPRMNDQRLTARDKRGLYLHQAFNPLALLPSAAAAGIRIANPPSAYPRSWKDGVGAYGRLYGDALTRRETGLAAGFIAAAISHEDIRYLPSSSHNRFRRVAHALLFTVVDHSDSGRNMPALSNFAGAAASGTVAMAYLPHGYDDWTHVGQRGAIAFATYAGSNLLNEFYPEWGPVLKKLHIPLVRPPSREDAPKTSLPQAGRP